MSARLDGVAVTTGLVFALTAKGFIPGYVTTGKHNTTQLSSRAPYLSTSAQCLAMMSGLVAKSGAYWRGVIYCVLKHLGKRLGSTMPHIPLAKSTAEPRYLVPKLRV